MASSSPQRLFLALVAALLLSTVYARLHRVNHLSANNAVTAMKGTVVELNSGIKTAEKLKETVRGDQRRAAYLAGCKTHYQDAVSNVKGALLMVDAGSAVSSYDVRNNMQSALFNVELCSTEWAESKIPDFPLKEVDEKLRKLVTDTFHLVAGEES